MVDYQLQECWPLAVETAHRLIVEFRLVLAGPFYFVYLYVYICIYVCGLRGRGW